MLPGKKDFVSVQQKGKQVHVQKRLILREVYQLFKEKFLTESVGFSRFAELHPGLYNPPK